MDPKEIIRPFVYFVAGVIISVVGLGALDITQVPTTIGTPTRVNVAQRANLPTRTLAPTSETTLSPEPAVAFGSTGTPVSVSEVTPTVESSPTVASSPTATFTPSRTATLISTTLPTIRRALTPTPRAALGPTPTPTLDPHRGLSPFTAISFSELKDEWLTINANSRLWFKLGEKTSYPIGMQIWLDAYGRPGIAFAVFSPEKSNNLNTLNEDTQPTGRGSLTKAVGHDLNWDGGSANSGTWYVLVTNTNSTPVQYKLNSSLNVKDHKNCRAYWEHIGSPDSPLVWWTWCE